jgi:prevent-host-death family protein
MSKVVGIRELKTRLGSYLREVRRGRAIVITDRGEPVAELRPMVLARSGTGAEIDRLVALGHLTRTSRTRLAPFRPIRHKGRPLSDTVVEDRENRF